MDKTTMIELDTKCLTKNPKHYPKLYTNSLFYKTLPEQKVVSARYSLTVFSKQSNARNTYRCLAAGVWTLDKFGMTLTNTVKDKGSENINLEGCLLRDQQGER